MTDAGTTLAHLATHGTHGQIAPTMAGAHLADVTNPQHRALRTAATMGRVLRGRGGESVAVLRAAARKGLLQLHAPAGGRRFDVDHATITDRGRRELARLDGEPVEVTPIVGDPGDLIRLLHTTTA